MTQWLALLAAACFIAACATKEVLLSRDGTVPVGVDFTGNWTIRNNDREAQRRLREAIRNTDGVSDRSVRPSRPPAPGRGGNSGSGEVRGGMVYVFLEIGNDLKVTQTADGLFISFDRSVVEEFRFGENRKINVGQVEAQRVTGWEGDELVVETLDRNRMKLTERFRLTESGQVLQRTIVLRSKNGEQETILQLFDRSS